MGRLSHRDTVRYVLSCDAYIFIREPSRKNNAGFPTKFVESFTCRAPVITTDTSDIKEYITASRRGTVLSPLSREEITAAMEKAAKEKRENDKNTPDSTFHFESYCDITEKWLRGF